MNRILCVDNKPKDIQTQSSLLNKKGFDVVVVDNPNRGLELLRNDHFSLLLTDIEMKPIDGIELINRVHKENIPVAIIIITAYYDRYEDQIKNLHIDFFIKPLPNISETERMEKFVRTIQKTANPFFLSMEEYLAKTDDEKLRIDQRIWHFRGDWIEKELNQRNAAWIMVCGDEVIDSSNSYQNIPNEAQIRKIANDKGKMPFLFCHSTIIEESPWSNVGKNHVEDYYPTIELQINGRTHIADFDTGSPETYISDDIINIDFNFSMRGRTKIHNVSHLKYLQKVEITIPLDEGGNVNSIEYSLFVIPQWAESEFISVNEVRKCLAGRDLLNKFPIEVRLIGRDKYKTKVYSI